MLLASAGNPDLILTTEPWLKTRRKHQPAEVTINGHDSFARCRLHKNAGGVLLYGRNNTEVVQLIKVDQEEYVSLSVEATLANDKYIFDVIYYRPPQVSGGN